MSVKISELTASSAVTSNDFLPIVDYETAATKRASANQVLDYITGSTFNTLTVTLLTGSTVTGTLAQFTTISGTNANISGNLVLAGEIDFSSYPDYAYIIYTSSYDKLVAYPGLYVSGNLSGSGNAAFQIISGTTGQFTVISASVVSASSYVGLPTSSGGTPGGTNQTVQFNSGSTFSGSTKFVWDYTNNRLGIGTTSPSSQFEVFETSADSKIKITSDSASSRAFLQVANNNSKVWEFNCQGSSVGTTLFGLSRGDKAELISNTPALIGTVTSHNITLGTNSTAAITIDASQRVGIGTSNPTSKLYIEGGSANWNETTQGKTVGTIHLDPGSNTDNFGNAITFGASDDSGDGADAQAGIYVRTNSTYGTKMYFATTDNYSDGSKNRMMIDYAGNVGIATTTPAYKLDVNGTVGVKDTLTIEAAAGAGNDSSLFFNARTSGDANSGVARFIADAGTGASDSKFKLQMIDADGGGWDDGFTFQASPAGDDHTYVGFGTTSPTVRLDVVGNGTTAAKFSSGAVIISGNLTVTGSATLGTVSGTIAQFTELTGNISFSASNPSYWTGTAPTNMQDALNRIAAAIYNGITGSIA